jgi:hypothetical protein
VGRRQRGQVVCDMPGEFYASEVQFEFTAKPLEPMLMRRGGSIPRSNTSVGSTTRHGSWGKEPMHPASSEALCLPNSLKEGRPIEVNSGWAKRYMGWAGYPITCKSSGILMRCFAASFTVARANSGRMASTQAGRLALRSRGYAWG